MADFLQRCDIGIPNDRFLPHIHDLNFSFVLEFSHFFSHIILMVSFRGPGELPSAEENVYMDVWLL